MRAAAESIRKIRHALKHPMPMLVALALGCMAIVGLDGWRTLEARRDIIRGDQEETANLARSLAQHAHDTFHLVDTILQGLRERVEMTGLNEAQLERLRNVMQSRQAASPGVSGLFIYDANGDWIVNSKTNVPGGLNNNDRAYFAYHRSHTDRDLFIGKPVLSKSDGFWVVTASLRINDARGEFAGVVLATLPVAYIAKFYQTFDLGQSGILTLATADGVLIARSPYDPNITGRDLSKSEIFSKFLPQGDVGSYRFSSVIDGIIRLGSYRRVQDFPLIIIVGHGLDDVLAEWRLTAALHSGISVILAIGVAIIGWKLVQQGNRIRRAERRYRLLADNSGDAIMCIGLDGQRLYVSPAFTTLTGWRVDEVMQMGWGELVHPEDREASRETAARLRAGETSLSSTFRYICRSGHALWVEARLNFIPATADDVAQYVVNIRDVSERKRVEEQLTASNRELEVQARTDGLTGIANRRRFDEALDDEWRRGARAETPLSVLMIDVDRFKLFNDRYGHGAGDVCLAQVAKAISGCVHRPGDLVARYGGEEISVVLPETGRAGALEIAETIRAAVQGLHIVHEGNAPAGVVTASIGAATRVPRFDVDEKAGGALELTTLADAALYEAKRTGRNKVNSECDVPKVMSPPLLVDEVGRLAAIASYGLGEKPASMDSLDRLARLTSVLFQAPIAMVSIVGSEQQCFIGRAGLNVSGTAREVSFCAHAITGEEVFTVADATADDRFARNPLVTGEPNIPVLRWRASRWR